MKRTNIEHLHTELIYMCRNIYAKKYSQWKNKFKEIVYIFETHMEFIDNRFQMGSTLLEKFLCQVDTIKNFWIQSKQARISSYTPVIWFTNFKGQISTRTEKLSFLELIDAFKFLFMVWKLHAIATTNAFSAVHIATKRQWHKVRIVLESPIFLWIFKFEFWKLK